MTAAAARLDSLGVAADQRQRAAGQPDREGLRHIWLFSVNDVPRRGPPMFLDLGSAPRRGSTRPAGR
jgi:hypothetical protein